VPARSAARLLRPGPGRGGLRQLRHLPLPPETWDGTVAAQKVLSTVVRLQRERGQKFGAIQIVDILMGRRSAKVIQFDHDQLSVFGIGEELAEGEWRGVVRQLLAQGLLAVEGEYGTLVLTEASGTVLRREREVPLRKEPKKPGLPVPRPPRPPAGASARPRPRRPSLPEPCSPPSRPCAPGVPEQAGAGRSGVRHLPRRHAAGDRHGVARLGLGAGRDQRGRREEAGDVRGGRDRGARFPGAAFWIGLGCGLRSRCRLLVLVPAPVRALALGERGVREGSRGRFRRLGATGTPGSTGPTWTRGRSRSRRTGYRSRAGYQPGSVSAGLGPVWPAGRCDARFRSAQGSAAHVRACVRRTP
jgi:hypothetical protein